MTWCALTMRAMYDKEQELLVFCMRSITKGGGGGGGGGFIDKQRMNVGR